MFVKNGSWSFVMKTILLQVSSNMHGMSHIRMVVQCRYDELLSQDSKGCVLAGVIYSVV